MIPYVGVFEGELERVLNGDTVQSSPRPGQKTGGEWDYLLRTLSRRNRRRLIGARYLTPGGLKPDEAADLIAAHIGGIETTDDALHWYCRTALRAVEERRRLAHRRRHHRHATRHGAKSYYDYRDSLAILAGYRSLWHYRKARGWT